MVGIGSCCREGNAERTTVEMREDRERGTKGKSNGGLNGDILLHRDIESDNELLNK